MTSKNASPCPECKRPASKDSESFPFCCDRCRLKDLGSWANGSYVISREILPTDDEEDIQEALANAQKSRAH